jgi:hypothetical protein
MNPLAALRLKITGELTRAQNLLAEKVHNDRSGVHATGIAIHNLVRGFAEMRNILAAPDWPPNDVVVARCLKAPESVLREATEGTPSSKDGVRAGTLMVFDLKSAQQRDAGPEVVFMAGSWSQCPAAAWVPALIRTVWERACRLPAPASSRQASGPLRLEFARAEAARRRVIYRRLLGCNLVVQGVLGITMLAAPLWICQFIGASPMAAALVRIWGLGLLLSAALYLQGWVAPISARWPNLVGVAGRFASALLYLALGPGFFPFALFDGCFAAALLWSYTELGRAELMSRP